MPCDHGKDTPPGRFDRVKQILNAATGDSNPAYQGYGRFWNLPLAQFLEVTIYGVRMIAPPGAADPCANLPVAAAAPPAKPGSCCHGGLPQLAAPPPVASTDAPVTGRSPGRGAKSGLIIGLRGQWPFDGTRFPPLLWGGAPVAAADIQFLSDWIDDGCPEFDSMAAGSEKALALSSGADAHISVSDNTNVIRSGAGSNLYRQSIFHLSDQEICELRYAFAELIKLNQWPKDMRNYNSWAQLHGDECPHGWSIFMPWHRMYLWGFEQALQQFVPTVTLPYWDWTASTAEQIAAGYIPAPYRCRIDDGVLGALSGQIAPGALAALQPLDGQDFSSVTKLWAAAPGISAADQVTIIAALKTANPLFTDSRYPGEFQGPIQQLFGHHYPTKDDIDRILAIDNWTEFGGGMDVDQSFGALDMNPHNTMHIWIGGQPDGNTTGFMLSNLTAALDPIFWAHHGNIDRLWYRWQTLHPGLDPSDLSDVLPGVDSTVEDSLSIAKLGYDYAADTYIFPANKEMSLTRFRSGDAGVRPRVLASHRRAEVVVTGIKQPNDSFLVRIFLNQPQADINTSIVDNPSFAGYFTIFGHGACIGGPGHCDPPVRRQRRFERVVRTHNDPWNIRMNVTDVVKNLVNKGAGDLQVNLVVIPTSPQAGPGALQIGSVALTFRD